MSNTQKKTLPHTIVQSYQKSLEPWGQNKEKATSQIKILPRKIKYTEQKTVMQKYTLKYDDCKNSNNIFYVTRMHHRNVMPEMRVLYTVYNHSEKRDRTKQRVNDNILGRKITRNVLHLKKEAFPTFPFQYHRRRRRGLKDVWVRQRADIEISRPTIRPRPQGQGRERRQSYSGGFSPIFNVQDGLSR